MADRCVILPLLLALSAAFPALVFFAVRPWLLRVIPPAAHAAGHLVHTVPGRAAAWLLAAELMAGPLDAHPDSYAARAAVAPPVPTADSPEEGNHS